MCRRLLTATPYSWYKNTLAYEYTDLSAEIKNLAINVQSVCLSLPSGAAAGWLCAFDSLQRSLWRGLQMQLPGSEPRCVRSSPCHLVRWNTSTARGGSILSVHKSFGGLTANRTAHLHLPSKCDLWNCILFPAFYSLHFIVLSQWQVQLDFHHIKK